MSYTPVWDLDVFFEGGSKSSQFAVYLKETEELVQQLDKVVSSWEVTSSSSDIQIISNIIDLFGDVSTKLSSSSGYVSCLEAQNTKDTYAKQLNGQLTTLSAFFSTVIAKFEEKIGKLEEVFFQELLQHDSLKEFQFVLTEIRTRAKESLPVEMEALIQSLGIDGYHGWSQLYSSLVASIQIPFEENGQIEMLSVGQAANKLSDPDREVRQKLFHDTEKAWKEKEELFAHALNHLAGFRLNVYKERGWDEVLKEPLAINRMQKETLDSMWKAINDSKEHLVKFLQRKAELLGIEKLSWYDVDAPLVNAPQQKLSYNEGAEFILNQFSLFGEQLTAFAKKAFEERWIEAEDRPNKRPGGFCTGFPMKAQSRIFMTYSGTLNNVSTLAHELGHAFHSYALKDVHPLNSEYAMNVAETASTFAEMVVSDAAVKLAKTKAEQIAMLEDKIQRSVALFMNIQARFLFETKFYEERKNGMVSAARLNELMTEAQKEAFGDTLDEYHPLFWASKLHFYITYVPFYNFPYTFGYLFSLGIYEMALASDGGFEEKYMALLQDTGRMTVEELAKKHLDEDLTTTDFWARGVQSCVKDIELFLQLTEEK